jgi:hypothetical protein
VVLSDEADEGDRDMQNFCNEAGEPVKRLIGGGAQ